MEKATNNFMLYLILGNHTGLKKKPTTEQRKDSKGEFCWSFLIFVVLSFLAMDE